MVASEKKHRFMDAVKTAAGHVSHAVMAGVAPHVTDGAERVMKNIDERILRVELRIFKRITTLVVLCGAGVSLLLALFFFLHDYAAWSSALASVVIGTILLITGLVLYIGVSSK